jgi:uncharacterized membrane protein YgcG
MKRLVIICLLAVLFPLNTTVVRAVSDPPLFSCSAPVGSSIASYSSGTHGIPGDTGTYTGSDAVYRVDSDHLLQCFCPDNNTSGIQSNWWKVTGLDQEEISYFQKRGWIYIPNGSQWGLEEAPYLVKNDFYACHSNGGGNGGSGGGSSSSSSTSGSSESGVGGVAGSILGVSTLAATGSARTILLFALVSLVFAYAAYRLRRE